MKQTTCDNCGKAIIIKQFPLEKIAPDQLACDFSISDINGFVQSKGWMCQQCTDNLTDMEDGMGTNDDTEGTLPN
jgi:hypothetical protein